MVLNYFSLRKILCLAIIILIASACAKNTDNQIIRILILSGKNNHEWDKTTPVLTRIFSNKKMFSTEVTNKPDTLDYGDFKNYNVLVSNWNNWPDTVSEFSTAWEKDFLKYIRRGGGALFIHAGASSFYKWKDYHKTGIGRWGKETRHGQQTIGKVTAFDQDHPVTKGFRDFFIFDELWEKTEIAEDAESLASVYANDRLDGHTVNEKAVFVNLNGKGRSFYTTLGHDSRAMLNSGFQTLILRAAQWAARREVTINPPAEIWSSNFKTHEHLQWIKSDTTLGLMEDSSIVWQLNFNNRFGRPYFHPLSVNKSIVTCTSPPDHAWHLGMWFCWKYINGINYWEYADNFKSEETGYRSDGITEIKHIDSQTHNDYSADVKMDILYHHGDNNPVLSESRQIHISHPESDGSYYIDEDHLFTALADTVTLDRTPIQKEPGGRTWGGYAGLSVRFSQDYTSPFVIAPDTALNYKKNKWVYMGFKTLSGGTAGTCIFTDPELTTPETSWYIIRTPETPFFYYSPGAIYDGKIILIKGKTLRLRYRTWIIGGEPSQEDLQHKYDTFLKSTNK